MGRRGYRLSGFHRPKVGLSMRVAWRRPVPGLAGAWVGSGEAGGVAAAAAGLAGPWVRFSRISSIDRSSLLRMALT